MTLHLIDGSGYVHRAFHAVRALRTSRGLPTNALFGLATMLRKFVRQARPELCAVVLDAGRETFRNEMFADYKINRPPAPIDLAQQFPYVPKLVQAMGFPMLVAPGFEADDIIATMTARARSEGVEVVVDSGDKDLLQLVAPGVAVFDPMRERTYDREGVIAKLGVPPERVIDYLALVGDASDNVPGVAGIGEKGAAELVSAWGPLESLYLHLADLTPRKREALEKGRESAFLSRELATLRYDVPVDVAVGALRLREPERAALVELLTELEFRAMLAEVQADSGTLWGAASGVGGGPAVAALEPASDGMLPLGGASTVVPVAAPRAVVGGEATLEEALRAVEAAESVAVAAVFGARAPVRPDCVGLGIATGPASAVVLRPADLPDAAMQRLAASLAGRPACIAGFKEVLELFRSRGADLPLPGLDPVLAGYVLHPERESQSLDALSLERLGETLAPPKETSAEAVARRACAAFAVWLPMERELEAAGLARVVRDTEVPLARVLAEMEATGVQVDREALAALSADLSSDLQRLEKQILDAAGMVFNPNSPKQLADVLFGKLQLPIVKKTKTGPSTDVTVLEELSSQHPVPALVLEYRSLAKLKGTYADALPALIHPVSGRIHTSYNQAVAATGRLSSSDPNLQNIPIRTETGRKIRRAFISGKGFEFVSADYSQIELRVLAHLSGDQQLIEAFRRDLDVHAWTAARIFHCDEGVVTPDQRRVAKVVNFGLLYGMGAFRLARDLKVSMGEAQRVIDDYFGAFPAVRRYLDGIIATARETGRVTMMSGRHRAIEGIKASNRNERNAAERMALNAPIQGTAADIIKVAMVRLRDRLRADRFDARMVLQVHDELVLEVREGQGDAVAAVLREVMESAMALAVPLKVEVGRGHVWSELH